MDTLLGLLLTAALLGALGALLEPAHRWCAGTPRGRLGANGDDADLRRIVRDLEALAAHDEEEPSSRRVAANVWTGTPAATAGLARPIDRDAEVPPRAA